MSLNEDVDRVPVMVDSSPEMVTLAPDSHEHFVQMPDVALSALPTAKLASAVESELPTPQPYAPVGDDHAAFREQLFDVSEAQRQSVICHTA